MVEAITITIAWTDTDGRTDYSNFYGVSYLDAHCIFSLLREMENLRRSGDDKSADRIKDRINGIVSDSILKRTGVIKDKRHGDNQPSKQ